jgi:hypothetical protein
VPFEESVERPIEEGAERVVVGPLFRIRQEIEQGIEFFRGQRGRIGGAEPAPCLIIPLRLDEEQHRENRKEPRVNG